MAQIIWDPHAREFLRKLPTLISRRIFSKVDLEVRNNPQRYLETLVGREGYKIRVGDYRLFVDYSRQEDLLTIRTVKHRKDAYKL
ncbi:type II toxin-antitoxin system RelE/ParE family toxin [Candidatus Woesearchaeota archaeon]|nr:type II toxin-antitoxin system RelE/ParE family toxin [Candidatus Woesearchaeota archaeon]